MTGIMVLLYRNILAFVAVYIDCPNFHHIILMQALLHVIY